MVAALCGAAFWRRWIGWKASLFYLLMFALLLSAMVPIPVYAQAAVQPPLFSVPHDHFAVPFQLALSSPTLGAQIRYTTDYSTPTPTNGTLYAGPITIDKTTVIRAIAYTSPDDKSISVTQTYIFLAQVRTQSNSPGGAWPNFFAPSNADGGPYPAYYEMAPEIVNHPNNASQLEGALLALPTISLVTDQPNLWDADDGIYVNSDEKGRAWERPLSIEWIDAATAGFTVNAGVRMHGQASRRPHRTPKKTFRLYFRGDDYGVPKLEYKLFPNTDAVAKFDKILLRGGGNRSFPYFDRDQRREADYINDEFARRIFLEMGGLAAHGTYAHVYLNGLYWGLYNVTERMDGDFLVDYLGGVPEDYDLIQPDEEVAYQPAADPGTLDAWNALQDRLNVATVDDGLYQQVLTQLNVVNLADYMILLHYIGNTDWPAHNWYTYRKRSGPDTRFHLIPWDSDTSLNNLNEDRTDPAIADLAGTPARLFYRLMTHPEFRQLVADRFYKHLEQSQGVLTPAQCAQTYRALASMIDQAIIGESARWGAYARKVYPQIDFTATNKATPAYFYSRDMSVADSDPGDLVPDNQQKNWVQVIQAKLNTYCPERTGVVINQYVQNGWYQTAVKAPTFSQEGGTVTQNYALAIDNAINGGNGTLYYTVDGVDPRAAGGAVAAGARDGADLATVTITQVATVRARVFAGGVWSPLHEATFYPAQPLDNLGINEIHYHPAAPTGVDGDLFEFIELYNKGTVALRVDNFNFSRGFTYSFPPDTIIAPDAYFVIASDATQFQARYGFSPNGVMQGNLSNGGEAIELVDAAGMVIDLVDYLDVAPWPVAPDGTGPSLALIQPDLDNRLASSWAASTTAHGTPGQPNGLALTNQAPLVSITTPAANATFAQGTPVTIGVDASDSDGTIQQVEFFANNVALCSVTVAPYSCTFTPVALGSVTLTARATDNVGAMATSPATSISVYPPLQPPVVVITSPAVNAPFVQGDTVIIAADASDPDGIIMQVEFLVDDTVVCTVNIPPYICSVLPTLGRHSLTAHALDSQGYSTTSAPVTITVMDGPAPVPTLAITITYPAADSTLLANTAITIQTAVSGEGIQKVDFLVDDRPLCTDDTAPYTCEWVPVASGLYTLKATVHNASGTAASATVTLTVAEKAPDGTEVNSRLYLPLVTR